MQTRSVAACVLAGVLVAAMASLAAAQDTFPTRPVKIVVPYPAGGTADAMARALGHELTGIWKQQVVVDNRPGGGTVVGAVPGNPAAPEG
jgi:tripartite-type tricarboxylate transporter receptor subunit TctC